MAECHEIIIAMDIVSTQKKNNIATNVSSSASINCYSKNIIIKRLLYFIYSFIIDYISIDNYYYFLLCKAKRYNMKWEIMNFKKLVLKIVGVIVSMT